MPLEVDWYNSQILVTSPTVDVDAQELYDTIRGWEDSMEGMAYEDICTASGKEDLGNNVYVGITINLYSPWQLLFWSSGGTVTVGGGNLVGGIAGDPIAFTAGVQVVLIQSANATIVVAGGSALTDEEHTWLSDVSTDTSELKKIIDNKKSLVKTGSTWQLIIYDDDNVTPILTKDLKDKDGNDITDLEAGVLAQELQTSV